MSQEARKPNTVQPKPGSQFEETKQREGRFTNRSQDEVQSAPASKVRAARKATHGKSVSADGSRFVEPLKKRKTDGGNGK
jgi:hypothetical protein